MGCKTGLSNGGCVGGTSNGTLSDESCNAYDPKSGGVTFTYTEYPQSPIRTGSHNVPTREANFVMYDSTVGTNTITASNCGKIELDNPCSNQPNSKITFDYCPSQLSFDFAYSDRFFAYLYDTSDKGGIVGVPCFHIEDSVASTAGGGNDGNVVTNSNCYPCSGFTCTPATTTLSYTAETDFTGDPDCPHPSLFGFGSTSNKVAFSYDALSSQLPNGVIDFLFSVSSLAFCSETNSELSSAIAF